MRIRFGVASVNITNNEIASLVLSIEHQYGGHATFAQTVPVRETFKGQAVWEGVVHVFDLEGHPKASKVYAWSNDAGTYVTVLHLGPIASAAHAVRAAIIQEFRSLEPAQES